MLIGSWKRDGMGRSLPLFQQALLLPIALAGLWVGAAAQSQALPSAGTRNPEDVRGSSETGTVPEPSAAPNLPIQRYKVRLTLWQGSANESWIVFDVIAGKTIILLKHATNSGIRWWDHDVLSGKACRIIQAEGGNRLVDCLKAKRSGPGNPLQIVLAQGADLHDYLLTFSWQESGIIQDGMARIDQTMKPEVLSPPRVEPLPPDSRSWRYKVKLSQGSAWRNLKPESWVVFDVIGGTTVTMLHTTNSYNLITGVSRWWDHPMLSSLACPRFPADARQSLAGCLKGTNSGPGEPLRIVLPRGTSLHDYRFSFTWQENGRIQEGTTTVEPALKPSLTPSP